MKKYKIPEDSPYYTPKKSSKMVVYLKKVYASLITNEVYISVSVFILAIFVVVFGTWQFEYFSSIIFPNTSLGLYNKEFWINIMVEAHGMLFDIFVIGIIILILRKSGEKRLEIKRYHETIDDYRHWQSEEAKYRIWGQIKRLVKSGVHKINLSFCWLEKISLNDLNLQESNCYHTTFKSSNLGNINLSKSILTSANFSHTMMIDTNLKNCKARNADFYQAILAEIDLENSELEGANFLYADLSDANLKYGGCMKCVFKWATLDKTNFEICYLSGADFSHAHLYKTNFRGAFLKEANFQEAELIDVIFERANLRDADFRHAKSLNIQQLEDAMTLIGAKFDMDLTEQLQDENYKHLFVDLDKELIESMRDEDAE